MADTNTKSKSEAAHSAYEDLGTRFEENDPREKYTYMYSKLR